MSAEPRVVMITGAAGNLGRAVARAFAGEALVLVGQHRDALAAAFGADSPQRLLAVANLLDQQQADRAVRAAIDRFGRLDVLCNLAGGFRMGQAVHETSDANWSFLFDLNARTLLNAVRAAVPRMLERGSGKVVNVSAFSALKGAAQMGAYTASKAVVIRLTEAMAAELRERGVNVNCVLPTIIDTPENRRAMPQADPAKWVAADDLAAVVRFLASDAARAIHGAAIPVTGLS
ncbi:MAG: Dihydroanticapsin 7-dehydrogenase [Burkholderiaceae bacterium]|nr:Dihydroanticapsin 7-dehydrogenase [Burkholderiaceae bacterium]